MNHNDIRGLDYTIELSHGRIDVFRKLKEQCANGNFGSIDSFETNGLASIVANSLASCYGGLKIPNEVVSEANGILDEIDALKLRSGGEFSPEDLAAGRLEVTKPYLELARTSPERFVACFERCESFEKNLQGVLVNYRNELVQKVD